MRLSILTSALIAISCNSSEENNPRREHNDSRQAYTSPINACFVLCTSSSPGIEFESRSCITDDMAVDADCQSAAAALCEGINTEHADFVGDCDCHNSCAPSWFTDGDTQGQDSGWW